MLCHACAILCDPVGDGGGRLRGAARLRDRHGVALLYSRHGKASGMGSVVCQALQCSVPGSARPLSYGWYRPRLWSTSGARASSLLGGVLKANAQLNWQMDVGNTTAGDMELIALTDFRQPGEVVLRVMLDIIVYVLMVAWLSFKAWQVVLPPCVPLAPVDCRPLLARARLSLFLALPLYERVSIKACLHQGLSTSRPV